MEQPTLFDLPWNPVTPQVKGIQREKAILKDIGALRHPMSGAGRIKDDGHDDQNLYEIKTAEKTHTVNSDELGALWKRAVKQNLDAVYLIEFGNGMVLRGVVEKT